MFTDSYFISTDKSLINFNVVFDFLNRESYWAKNIPATVVAKAIEGSFCFGVYKKDTAEQIGFARVITDKATFGYLADVFILNDYRGSGIGKWLIQTILHHEELQGFRSWLLGTKDAHGLYEQFGFERVVHSERLMRLGLMNGYSTETQALSD